MEEDKQLADFQAVLLALLHQDLEPEIILQHLRNNPAFGPFKDYIDTFDLRSVQVAAELVKQWGRRVEDLDSLA